MAVGEYLMTTRQLLLELDHGSIDTTLHILRETRRGGRLFFLGNGGGAGHASHAAADFRSVGFEAYAFDSMSELTARGNDFGWGETGVSWLRSCRLGTRDVLFVFSVGGGSDGFASDVPMPVSLNLTRAIRYASYVAHSKVLGVVGADGGTLAKYATCAIVLPTTDTAQVEGIQAVVWHLLMTEIDK